MTDYKPVFQSPIVTEPPDSIASGSVQITDLTGAPAILIQGDAAQSLQSQFAGIPATPGDVIAADGGLLARLTPGELYLFGISAASELEAGLTSNQPSVRATDVTHGKAVVKLTGPAAGDVLSKICGLDFHDSAFPSMQVKQTSAAKIKTLIARCDQGDTPVYYLHVARSLGQYFWDILWDAGQEFGVGVG